MRYIIKSYILFNVIASEGLDETKAVMTDKTFLGRKVVVVPHHKWYLHNTEPFTNKEDARKYIAALEAE